MTSQHLIPDSTALLYSLGLKQTVQTLCGNVYTNGDVDWPTNHSSCDNCNNRRKREKRGFSLMSGQHKINESQYYLFSLGLKQSVKTLCGQDYIPNDISEPVSASHDTACNTCNSRHKRF